MKALLKKSASLILTLGIVISLAACSTGSSGGTQGESDGKIKLTLWDQSVGNTDPSAKLLPEIVEKWNSEHPDIQVERTGRQENSTKPKSKHRLRLVRRQTCSMAWVAAASCSRTSNPAMCWKSQVT
ncbi:hypothetical protein [Paenibacillus sp. W2I17]|uniref:hypothetical protein n=1 Tax=Paenibacillus sp. W2I17 TaxID=3042311 RepID=UPI002780D8CD|nr:hypothetical protein [Paenibacillus sp. W2I17]MDQ0659209.1 hypothetical protein [Paenibacillus sp. W2I17]